MQDLDSTFWGFALAKAPINCSSESEGTNTNLPELFPPRSPLKVFCGRHLPPSRPKRGQPQDSRVVLPLVGTRAAHTMLEACWVVSLLAVLLLWPSKFAIVISPWDFGPALTSYCTHCRTSNFPQTAPIVGSRISDWAHCNEFVESGSKSWALMRRRLVLGMKSTQNWSAQRPKEKGPFTRGWGCAIPSRSYRSLLPFFGPPPLLVRSLLLYILLFCSSSSYTCQSSKPILKCTSHRPSFLALCELLWPLLFCPEVTSTLMGSEC